MAVNEDPNPLTTGSSGSGGNQPNPDQGKDYRYLDPVLGVVDGEPSYNQNPAGSSSGGAVNLAMADVGPFSINLGSVRAVELGLLSKTQQAVHMYGDLRMAVMNATNTQYFWGPPPPNPLHDPAQNHKDALPTMVSPSDKGQKQLSDTAQQFGTIIDPVMEKALYQVAGALETLGAFIATVNLTGQSYGQIDRASKFPEPPSGTTHS